MTLFSIDSGTLSRLSAERAVEAFRDLLFAAARVSAIPITQITISSRIYTADGGIDASILGEHSPGAYADLLAPRSRYQFKTGESAAPWQEARIRVELFGKGHNAVRKEKLGEAVQRCLDDGGRYVLVCFGIDFTDQQRQKSIQNLTDLFRRCGYENAEVEVWGQTQLIGLFSAFPGLCLKLTGRGGVGFRSHLVWSETADMRPTLRLGIQLQELIDEIRSHLRGGNIGHIRLIGEPGVGKTRLALEATRTDDLAPLVVYVADGETFQRSPLLNELIQLENSQAAILVIDECLAKDRASIWNLLSPRSQRIRMITIDHGPEESGGGGMRVVQVPATDGERLAEIIADYGIDRDNAVRWATFCEGCPRVAHVIGDNLRNESQDLLQCPSTVDVWTRFIVWHDDPQSERVALRKIVLRHVALFQRFGFEPPVDQEAQFIAKMAMECDPRLTWQQFQSIVTELKQRRILQGSTTVYITPRLLQIYLFREFWTHHGRGVSLVELLGEMPPMLWGWFVEMLKYSHMSPVAEAAVARLLSRDGLFVDGKFPDDRHHGKLILAFAEASPAATLRCLQRTIGALSAASLQKLTEARQHIVWALERIAVQECFFVDACEVLLALAEEENANCANNATGTFQNLFSLVPGMAATEAAPGKRFAVLRSALASSDDRRRGIGVGAWKVAMSNRGGMRLVGAEHQGLRETVKFWFPKTYDELWKDYREAWNILAAQLTGASGYVRRQMIAAIIESAWSTLHIPSLTLELVRTLENVADDPETDAKALVEFVKRQLRGGMDQLPGQVTTRLRELDSRLEGRDFPSRLRRWVRFSGVEDSVTEDGKSSGELETKLDQLADEAALCPDLLKAELDWLLHEQTNQAFAFGFRIANRDVGYSLLAEILSHQISPASKAPLCFLSGYLAAMHQKDSVLWERATLQLSNDLTFQEHFAYIVIDSGLTDAAVERVIDLVEQGDLNAERLRRWWSASRLRLIGEPIFLRLIKVLLSLPGAKLWENAVRMCDVYYSDQITFDQLPPDDVFRLLTDERIAEDRLDNSTGYHWSRLATAFITQFPTRKWEMVSVVLTHGNKHWSTLADLDFGNDGVLTNLAKSDPAGMWRVIAAALEQLDSKEQYGIQSWLRDGSHRAGNDKASGPIQYIPATLLFSWIDEDVNNRVHWVAGILPKTLDQSPAGRLTHDFLVKYGSDQNVADSVHRLFRFGVWRWGPESDNNRVLRDEAREWLAAETDETVIRWIERYCDALSSDIKRAEIDEERDQ